MQVNNDTPDWDHYEEDNVMNAEDNSSSSSNFNLNKTLDTINNDFDRQGCTLPITFKFIHQNITYHSSITEKDGNFILNLKIELTILPYTAENPQKRQLILEYFKNSHDVIEFVINKNSVVELYISTVFGKNEKFHATKPSAQKIVEVILITLMDIDENIADIIQKTNL